MSPEQIFGSEGEAWVYRQLVQRGYSPTMPPDFFREACDLMIGNLCIEVKIARQTLRRKRLPSGQYAFYPRWQWFLPPTLATIQGEWVLILIAQNDGKKAVYIIPGAAVGERRHIQLTSPPNTYNGWLSPWRDQWPVVDYLLQKKFVEQINYHQWQATL